MMSQLSRVEGFCPPPHCANAYGVRVLDRLTRVTCDLDKPLSLDRTTGLLSLARRCTVTKEFKFIVISSSACMLRKLLSIFQIDAAGGGSKCPLSRI